MTFWTRSASMVNVGTGSEGCGLVGNVQKKMNHAGIPGDGVP
jgi:hypothetical protein